MIKEELIDKIKTINPNKIVNVIISCDIIKDIIEKEEGEKILNNILNIKNKFPSAKICITFANLQRGIWISKNESQIKNIKLLFDSLDIVMTPEEDYKDEDKVKLDTIALSKYLSTGGKMLSGDDMKEICDSKLS